jgi:hypothetical protein
MMMTTADEYIVQANHIDYDDCGKKALCLLAAKKKGIIVYYPLQKLKGQSHEKGLEIMTYDGRMGLN